MGGSERTKATEIPPRKPAQVRIRTTPGENSVRVRINKIGKRTLTKRAHNTMPMHAIPAARLVGLNVITKT